MKPWRGLVEGIPLPGRDEFADCRGAFVNVVALARDKDDFVQLVSDALADEGLRATEFEDIEPVHTRRLFRSRPAWMIALANQLNTDTPVVFDTFHVFESEEDDDG